MADANPVPNTAPVVLFMSAFLLFSIWKAVTLPGGEWPPAALAYMHFGLDLALTVLLLVLLVTLRQTRPGPLRMLAYVVGPAGLAAGAALLWIRLSSDLGWWTGHLNP